MRDHTMPGDAQEPDEVVGFLLALRALGESPAPAPTPELAALIGGAVAIRNHPYRRHAVRALLAAAALVAALVGAAANHSLPQPAQRVVSNLVDNLTPFHIDPGSPPPPPAPSQSPNPGPGRTGTDEPPGSGDSNEPSRDDDRSTRPTQPSTESSSAPEPGDNRPEPGDNRPEPSQSEAEPVPTRTASEPVETGAAPSGSRDDGR